MGGNTCNCSKQNGPKTPELQLQLGIDLDQVEEVHHFHGHHDLREYLTYQDLFMRECFKPMYLMKVQSMFSLIDEVVVTHNFQQEQKKKASADQSFLNGKSANTTKMSSQIPAADDLSDGSDCE